MSQVVFVLGTGRCGSTVVQELLAHHPDVGFISNLDAAVPALDLKGSRNASLYALTPPIARRRDRAYLIRHRASLGERLHVGPSEAYALFRSQVSPVLVDPVRDLTERDADPWLANRFRSFLDARIDAQDKPVFLHKFTGWPRARFIHAVYPDARFIHVVRDGRAVASSLVQRPWWQGHLGPERWGYGELPHEDREVWEHSGRDFTVLAALAWKQLLAAFEACRSALPEQAWLELRFEDIVADPRGSIGEALRACGLAWDDRFEEAFGRYPIVDENVDRYRRDLAPETIAAVEAAIAPELVRWGYDVGQDVSAGASTS